jgi:ferredoxin
MARRARDDWQGPLGFARGIRKRWTVTFDENDPEATFPLIHGQEIASAAQSDKREYRSRDVRCTPGEGPIPVECRAASCGTCWVGMLGGAEKLSPVVDRDEKRRMDVFGYVHTDEPRPLIRLACQAKAFGAVSIVIPPWNGVFGKFL